MPPTLPQIGSGAIDTHAHIYPADYLDLLERAGVDPATTAIARNLSADRTEADMTKRLHWMDQAGVAAQVLAVTPQVPSGPEAASSLEAARWINDCYAEVVRAHPGRFLAYGALPLPHVDESLQEVARVFDDLGVVGISVPTVLPGKMSLADERLEPVWAALHERGAVVNIHATGSGACSPLITDYHLTWVNGALVEDAIAVLHLLKAGVPDKFPGIRWHVAHLGGDLPFFWQRMEDNYTDWNAFPSSPTAALRRMWYDAANFTEPALRLAAELYGAGQIMGGSDIPYFQTDKYVRAFDYIRTAGLDQGDRDAILSGNARALYGLSDPA